jgi:hypothetical protein
LGKAVGCRPEVSGQFFGIAFGHWPLAADFQDWAFISFLHPPAYRLQPSRSLVPPLQGFEMLPTCKPRTLSWAVMFNAFGVLGLQLPRWSLALAGNAMRLAVGTPIAAHTLPSFERLEAVGWRPDDENFQEPLPRALPPTMLRTVPGEGFRTRGLRGSPTSQRPATIIQHAFTTYLAMGCRRRPWGHRRLEARLRGSIRRNLPVRFFARICSGRRARKGLPSGRRPTVAARSRKSPRVFVALPASSRRDSAWFFPS